MPRRSRSKKAVSPVIANVLMVMAVFALGTILFAWATSSFGMYQGGAGVWFVNRGDALKERLVIECIDFTGTPPGPPSFRDRINVYVRNIGTIDLKIAAIYINRTVGLVSAIYINGTVSSFPVSLGVGQVKCITVLLSSSWRTNSITSIMVATARGNSASGTWKA